MGTAGLILERLFEFQPVSIMFKIDQSLAVFVDYRKLLVGRLFQNHLLIVLQVGTRQR